MVSSVWLNLIALIQSATIIQNNMKDIKFRIWDKSYNRWLKKWVGINNLGVIYEDSHGFEDLSLHGNAVIQQYTGLKDSNGVEIYNGDIIQYQTLPQYGPLKEALTCQSPVFWGEYSDDEYVSNVECWMLNHNLPLSQAFHYGVEFGRGGDVDSSKPILVIGNIMENPSLLAV